MVAAKGSGEDRMSLVLLYSHWPSLHFPVPRVGLGVAIGDAYRCPVLLTVSVRARVL